MLTPRAEGAATIVAGTLTTTPTAAARPMHLCIVMPDKLMMMLVMIPPPTPAKPENSPMLTPAASRNVPLSERSVTGRNLSGNAKRAAKTKH